MVGAHRGFGAVAKRGRSRLAATRGRAKACLQGMGLKTLPGAGRWPRTKAPSSEGGRYTLGDEELEGAGDDAEFDGEARERLTVDLRVYRIGIERLANDGVGFEKFDAGGAAKSIAPKRRQIAEIAEAAARGKSEDFEAVFEEVCFGGDFERAAVVLRAADDDE